MDDRDGTPGLKASVAFEGGEREGARSQRWKFPSSFGTMICPRGTIHVYVWLCVPGRARMRYAHAARSTLIAGPLYGLADWSLRQAQRERRWQLRGWETRGLQFGIQYAVGTIRDGAATANEARGPRGNSWE